MQSGSAGASARREYEQRRAAREAHIRRRFGRVSRLVLAVAGEPQPTRAWAMGAAGERLTARRLDPLTDQGLAVLHDRRIPGTRANLDHLVVTNAGVTVIDTKQYRGRIEVGRHALTVAGRDRTKLVDGLDWQVATVTAALPGIAVTGALCFVNGQFAWVRSRSIRGYRVTGPKRLAKELLEAHDSAPRVGVEMIAAHREDHFAPA